MSDLIAAVLGYLSSKYSQNKISKFSLSLIAGGLFFLGYFIAEIIRADKPWQWYFFHFYN